MILQGECSICSDQFSSEIRTSVTPCGHVFHAPCIQKWAETKKSSGTCSCPQCSRTFELPDVVDKLFVDLCMACSGCSEKEESILLKKGEIIALKRKINQLLALNSGGLKKKSLDETYEGYQREIHKLQKENGALKNDIEVLKYEKDVDLNIKKLLQLTSDLHFEKTITQSLREKIKTLENNTSSSKPIKIAGYEIGSRGKYIVLIIVGSASLALLLLLMRSNRGPVVSTHVPSISSPVDQVSVQDPDAYLDRWSGLNPSSMYDFIRQSTPSIMNFW